MSDPLLDRLDQRDEERERIDVANSKVAVIAALDNLSNLYALADTIHMEKEALRDKVLTPEIRRQLAEIDAELDPRQDAVVEQIEQAQATAKKLCLEHGETVNGAHLQAVYNQGRTSWDTERLTGYATAHPEIVAFCRQGQPSITLRKR